MKKKIIIWSILAGLINLIAIIVILCIFICGVLSPINESDKYVKGSKIYCSEEEFVKDFLPLYEEHIDNILIENNLVLNKFEMEKNYDVYQIIYYSDDIYLEFIWNYTALKTYNYAEFYINCYLYNIEISNNVYNNEFVLEIEKLIKIFGNEYCYDFHFENDLISKLHQKALSEEKNNHYESGIIYYYDSLVGNLGYKYNTSESGNDSSNYYDPINESNRSFLNIQCKFLLKGNISY